MSDDFMPEPAMSEGAGPRGRKVPAAPSFEPNPVQAVEAFRRGGRGRIRVLVVCAAPLGEGLPLDLRREWHVLRRRVEQGRIPATLFRLIPPTRSAFSRAVETRP